MAYDSAKIDKAGELLCMKGKRDTILREFYFNSKIFINHELHFI